MKLVELVEQVRKEGFKLNIARVKVCQEILMSKLVISKYNNSVLFKGGTIMYQLSKEMRRSTEDVDIDLVKLSIATDALVRVFNEIGIIDSHSGIQFEVLENKIESLKHPAYEGKRVVLQFTDQSQTTMTLKLDVGIHTEYRIEQSKVVFDCITSDNGIELLANPIEQMIVEKTSSFIRLGAISTRMKDVFDIYYLITNHSYSKQEVANIIQYQFIETKQVQSLREYVQRMQDLLSNEMFKNNLSRSQNWTGSSLEDVISTLIQMFTNLC